MSKAVVVVQFVILAFGNNMNNLSHDCRDWNLAHRTISFPFPIQIQQQCLKSYHDCFLPNPF